MKTFLRLKLLYGYWHQKALFASLLALERQNAGQILRGDFTSNLFKNAFQEKMTCFHLNKGLEMVPTVYAQETLVVRKIPYVNAKFKQVPLQVCVGDVVVLKDPLDSANFVVRRLAAVSGDEMVSNKEEDEPFVLEKDQCWVVADNKELKPGERNDSRTYGPVPITNIMGRAIYRYRNLDHQGFIVNSPASMQSDMPVFYSELDSKEMLEHNEKSQKDSET